MEQKRIGEILVANSLLTQEQLQQALTVQKQEGGKLGQVLINLKILTEKQFLEFFAAQIDIPFISLGDYKLDIEFSLQLPESQARLFRVILLQKEGEGYLVGAVDPQDIFAADELTRILERPVKFALIAESAFLNVLDLVYRRTEEIHGFAERLETELQSDKTKIPTEQQEGDTAVAHLIHSLFTDAVQVNASDIHIEPEENVLRLRQRIDGELQEQIIEEGNNIAAALSQRLKLMAGLNIAEKRLPQDGHFNIKIRGMPIDVRLSTMPVEYGESIVMRLLNQSTGILDLDTLGMSPQTLEQFRKLIKLPKGIILVTGPTGCGKTTTLYAALKEMNDVSKKFITIEDPIEYRLPRINQIQVRSELGLTFARVLRSTLRQDPDIILVGEIRDLETASIALRAALTGHLVLATLHTNDAASTVMRLIDIGAENYLVAATVTAALAQRLVRKICPNCKEPYQPTAEESSYFKEFYPDKFSSIKLFHGIGCEHCNNTGYLGRIGVYELLEFDKEMKETVRLNDVSEFARLTGKALKDHSLFAQAFGLAAKGETTLSEVLRVAGEQD